MYAIEKNKKNKMSRIKVETALSGSYRAVSTALVSRPVKDDSLKQLPGATPLMLSFSSTYGLKRRPPY
jgi:hypothetical protein